MYMYTYTCLCICSYMYTTHISSIRLKPNSQYNARYCIMRCNCQVLYNTTQATLEQNWSVVLHYVTLRSCWTHNHCYHIAGFRMQCDAGSSVVLRTAYMSCTCTSTYMVPGICSLDGVSKDYYELDLWHQWTHSLWSIRMGKVGGTLLKQQLRGVGLRKVGQVPAVIIVLSFHSIDYLNINVILYMYMCNCKLQHYFLHTWYIPEEAGHGITSYEVIAFQCTYVHAEYHFAKA